MSAKNANREEHFVIDCLKSLVFGSNNWEYYKSSYLNLYEIIQIDSTYKWKIKKIWYIYKILFDKYTSGRSSY